MKLKSLSRAFVCGLLLLAGPALHAQSLAVNTVAGFSGQGGADGAGSAAQFNNPANVAVDSAGNVYVADTDNHTIRMMTASGVVTTIAGTPGVSGISNALGASALFNQPMGIAVDTSGNLYVADTGNHVIRKLTPTGSTWAVGTLAGTAGVSGSLDANGTSARFNTPEGVAVDASGNVYVADTWNHTIRSITPGGGVGTLAGLAGNFGTNDGTGSFARFYQPQGIAVDSSGMIYVADTANQTIRKVTTGGSVSTLAGTPGTYGYADGINALFYKPAAVTVDGKGNVYVADYFNSAIRMITPSKVVSTIAGSAGTFGNVNGTNSAAQFRGPGGIAAVGTNVVTLYVADSGNATIRGIAQAGAIWTVTTLAGAPSAGSTDDVGSAARFYAPGSVAVGVTGLIYVADSQNNTIREITTAGPVTTLAGLAGSPGGSDGLAGDARFFGPQAIALDGSGNVFVADSLNATVRKVTPGGSVTTFAGSAGQFGFADGQGSNARFYRPTGIAVDNFGYVYVADAWNQTIRKITPGGMVSTLAGAVGSAGSADGTNSAARFNGPMGLAVDSTGNIYVCDFFNNAIRKVTPAGMVTTIAGLGGVWGSVDSTNTSARFFQPTSIALGASGNLYVADSGNYTLRKLSLVGNNWVVSTVAGQAGVAGSVGGLGTNALFSYPGGVAINSAGLFCIADTGNNTICLSKSVVTPAPFIFFQPQDLFVAQGGSATFTVVAGGAIPLSYQWSLNSNPISGATGSSYTRSNVQSKDLGSYSVLVFNGSGNVTSSNALLALSTRPIITRQPQPQGVLAGQPASFNVIASGSPPLKYQWRFNDIILPGATASAYLIAAAWPSNSGAYSVIVSNAGGMVVSTEAPLVVTGWSVSGDNSLAQLDVPSDATNLIAVASGSWHNVALRADGTVVAWGDDSAGQCDQAPPLAGILAVAAGGYHSLAIKRDYTVTAWGADDSGQGEVPPGLTNVIALGAGYWHNLALRRDGSLAGWGDNSWGQTNLPSGVGPLKAIAAGGSHNLALKTNGTVVAWGENTDANGVFVGQSVVPLGLSNVIALAAGDYHSLALRADGTVAAWGDNSQGQCNVPAGLSNAVAVAGGGAHSLALKADGTLAAWGANMNGQCDLVISAVQVAAISAGETHSIALTGGGPPTPLILNPGLRSHQFSGLIQTLARKHYALESKGSLNSPNWNVLSVSPGNGALEVLTDPAATAPQTYYRVEQW